MRGYYEVASAFRMRLAVRRDALAPAPLPGLVCTYCLDIRVPPRNDKWKVGGRAARLFSGGTRGGGPGWSCERMDQAACCRRCSCPSLWVQHTRYYNV